MITTHHELRLLLGGLITFVLFTLFTLNVNTGIEQKHVNKNIHLSSALFRRRPETKHIKCGVLLRNDQSYGNFTRQHRAKLVKDESLDMSCQAIRNRIWPQRALKPLSFGVAFARNVFMDYELLEDTVRSNWHPQNYFCFTVDSKSSSTFKKKVGTLASCIDNVFVSPTQFNMTSHGHYTNHAHMECLKILIEQPGWNYVLLLQNHDIVIKTSYELVKLYSLLNGSNDMQIMPVVPRGRWNKSHPWTPKKTHLFVNESDISPSILNRTIIIGKGAVHLSLVREAVQWLVYTVNLTQIMTQFNSMPRGVDEQLFQTLHINEFLGMPGGFSSICLNQSKYVDYISRFNVYGSTYCKTKVERHSSCIFGIEDLSRLSKLPQLSANKVIPDFDYGIVDCIHELIFNRTFLNQENFLNKHLYRKLPHVIYNEFRKQKNLNVTVASVCVDTSSLWKF